MKVSFQIKRLQLKNYDDLQKLIEKFTIHNLSAPRKHEILELKKNYVRTKHGPMEHNQGDV